MVRFTHPAQQIVLQDYIDANADAEARVEHLTAQIAGLLPGWNLAPVVEAAQAMRGVGFIVAVTVVADSADFVADLRQACVTPHIARKARHSAIDGRTKEACAAKFIGA